MKHRQQLCDLERQQDGRVADALCDHWKVSGGPAPSGCLCLLLLLCVCVCVCDLQKLRASWSKRLGDRVKDAVLGSVPARSEVSARRCEELWAELELQLAAQMQRAEGATKLQLEDAGARLDHDAQVDSSKDEQEVDQRLPVGSFYIFYYKTKDNTSGVSNSFSPRATSASWPLKGRCT